MFMFHDIILVLNIKKIFYKKIKCAIMGIHNLSTKISISRHLS
jgi:hypothetical protein